MPVPPVSSVPSAAGIAPVSAPDPASPDAPVPPRVAELAAGLRAAGCVFAEDEARLILATARTPDEATAMAARRASGPPLEHVLGWAEFLGLRIAVGPGVFVPRRRTEFLASCAVALTSRRLPAPPVVVDLCCGSGAVGAAVLTAVPGAELVASDIDPTAVRCARRNVEPRGGRVLTGDLFDALPAALRGRVDVLIANVPYVPSGEVALLPGEARDHEPLVALDGGADGLDVLRRVAVGAPYWLGPNGVLLVETSGTQAPHAVAAFRRAGLGARVQECDEPPATVVIGVRPTEGDPPLG
ncbi:putative protein N(5)-glutamine methyltransferase [Streptomyces sp. NPDC127068]|uniref:putative protein N(5)-glutamine methyltransferase n=1 Tax=Streptomyces sp. NPDC127068 TaxID=3347127 RepID=UPI003649C5C7